MKTNIKIHNKNELISITENKAWYIFGAGKCADYVLHFTDKLGKKPDKIFVSSLKENPSNVCGIPVVELDDRISVRAGTVILVATKEAVQENILKKLVRYKFDAIYTMGDEMFYQLGYEYELLNSEIKYLDIKCEIDKKRDQLLRFVPHPCMDYMVLNILDNCNLRCKGCDHFACIAEPYYVSLESVHKDLDRMAEILEGDYLTQISVMGGEPLLHPDLLPILKDVREHFRYATIRLTTNGLLLMKQNQEFWHVLHDYGITIINTRYPLKLDYPAMKKKAEDEGVDFRYFEGTGDINIKKLFKKKINLKGDSNPAKSFSECHISNYGNFLMEGKLYGCPFSCQSYRIFNKRYGQNLRMTKMDYLDIYQIKDKQEIFDFAARPKYYCRYCTGLSETFEWQRSEKKITEWV